MGGNYQKWIQWIFLSVTRFLLFKCVRSRSLKMKHL